MGLVHSIPGLYFPVPGSSAVVLKGSTTFIRVTEGISHQRASYICYTKPNLRSGENPDTGRKCDPEHEVVPGRHSYAFRMGPACVVAVPTHGRPAVMNFSVGCIQISMKFRQKYV